MKKRVDVQNLKIGMYICELDRPWLESSFVFQGFFVESKEQLEAVQKECEYVIVDTLRILDLPENSRLALPSTPGVITSLLRAKGAQRYPRQVAVEEELQSARIARSHTRKFIDNVFADVQSGRIPDLKEVRETVANMVESIVRNPDAQLCLAQLKNRDEYTAQHSVNVCVLTITFGRHLGLSVRQLNLAGMGALLHDIGKLRTPLEILNKPGKLTDEEFAIMRAHPHHGREILEASPGIPPAVIDVAFTHHERLYGHGYPRGLKADEISLWSKMVAIVDVYDAITSDRIYHDGMNATEALTRMYEWRERDFDPVLLEQFTQCIGIYPIGTLVELHGGEVGIVISTNPELRLRPKVLVVLDEEKRPCFPTRIVDLAQFVEREEGIYAINKVLEAGTHNVDVQQHIRELKAV